MADMQRWLQQKAAEAASTAGDSSNGAAKPAMAGLQYTLPSLTNGVSGTMR